jgi:hypothetical protein
MDDAAAPLFERTLQCFDGAPQLRDSADLSGDLRLAWTARIIVQSLKDPQGFRELPLGRLE